MSLIEKIKSLFCCSDKCGCGCKKKKNLKESEIISGTDLEGDSSVQKFEDDGAEIKGADAVAEEVIERPIKDGD
ncbi:MAG: hypothetical protein FWD54_06160 [Endomicrobia bacterium]|nr:hypothetical protein [Endomicrobiia bacterium]